MRYPPLRAYFPMPKALKVLGIIVGCLTGLWIASLVPVFLFQKNCVGRLRDCYAAVHTPDASKRERTAALTQFGASSSAIAFPVFLGDGHGLLLINRNGGQPKLIYEKGFGFWSPHLSADGKRLVVIRRHEGSARREIVSCSISSWRCEILWQTEDNLRSPVEVDENTIVYASTPLRIRYDGKPLYADWNIHILHQGMQPVRLTDFDLYELPYMAVAGDKIFFSGAGPKDHKPAIPKLEPLAANTSEVYAVEFDAKASTIRKPAGVLQQLFRIGGRSIQASISSNGNRAAIRNTEAERAAFATTSCS